MIISDYFIDNYFENSNPSFILVYIMLLRLCTDGVCSASRVADSMNVMEGDVRRAMKYWEALSVINVTELEDGAFKIGFPLERAEKETNSKNEQKTDKASEIPLRLPAVAVSRPVYTSKEIDYYMENSVGLRKLFKSCEMHMGKLLSYNDMCVLFSFHDWLRMPFELVELLVEYCCSNGHRSIRYIESVAVTWADAGICTPELAKERIKLYNSDFRQIMGALGKRDREPTKIEEGFMVKWRKTFSMPLDIVMAACERTVLLTSKPTFQYADRIIERWHAAGVATRADIEKEDAEFRASADKSAPKRPTASKTRKTAFSNFKERETADFSEIQKLEMERINKELGL